MNTVLLSVLGLLALSSHAFGIVCPPDFCTSVKCPAVTAENCLGQIVPNGSFCGCCAACRAILHEGESCWMTLIHGVPPAAQCDTGLVCNLKTYKCEKPAV